MTYAEKLEALRAAVEEQEQAEVTERHPGLGPDYIKAVIREGKKYDKIDVIRGGQQMGRLMVDPRTGEIFGIKAYGKIHRGHKYGTLDTIDEWHWGSYYAGRKADA